METTEGKKRYPLDLAELVGQSVVKWLAGACEKIEIAGSIRRRETTIGDIEILAIPKVGGRDMFGEPVEEPVSEVFLLTIIVLLEGSH